MTESQDIELAPYNIEVKTIYPGLHATKIFTKLDSASDAHHPAMRFYQKYFDTFNSAQTALTHATAPSNIANAVFTTATISRGPLHIVFGGDAKLYAFFKKILSQRAFQSIQTRSTLQPLSKLEIAFAKWMFGSNTRPLEVVLDTPA